MSIAIQAGLAYHFTVVALALTHSNICHHHICSISECLEFIVRNGIGFIGWRFRIVFSKKWRSEPEHPGKLYSQVNMQLSTDPLLWLPQSISTLTSLLGSPLLLVTTSVLNFSASTVNFDFQVLRFVLDYDSMNILCSIFYFLYEL